MHLEKPDTSGKWQTEYLKPKFHFDDYESSPSVQGKVKYVDTLSLITFFHSDCLKNKKHRSFWVRRMNRLDFLK